MGGVNVVPRRKLNALLCLTFVRYDQSEETFIYVKQEKYQSDKINYI